MQTAIATRLYGRTWRWLVTFPDGETRKATSKEDAKRVAAYRGSFVVRFTKD